MPELSFEVDGIEPGPAAAAPELVLGLCVSCRPAAEPIDNLLLQVQVRLQVRQRRYTEAEQGQLVELFGAPGRWGETVQSLLWTRATVMVPAFSGTCRVAVPLPCSYDFNVAAARYFHALEEGEVPFTVQLSGSIFFGGAAGRLQVVPVPWSAEASGRLPVACWRQLMEEHYPGTVPLVLDRQLVERLRRFRTARGLLGWDRTLEALLDAALSDAAPPPETR